MWTYVKMRGKKRRRRSKHVVLGVIIYSRAVRRVTKALRVSSWKFDNANRIYGRNFQQNCQWPPSAWSWLYEVRRPRNKMKKRRRRRQLGCAWTIYPREQDGNAVGRHKYFHRKFFFFISVARFIYSLCDLIQPPLFSSLTYLTFPISKLSFSIYLYFKSWFFYAPWEIPFYWS